MTLQWTNGQIAKNCNRRQPRSHLRPPPRGTPARMCACTLYFQRVIGLHFLLIARIDRSLFKFVQWAHQSAFWPFKVIQGRWFWYQSKAHIRLPISPSVWLWSYLALFLRYVDLFAKNCLFFLPLSHSESFGALAPYIPFGISRWS